MTNKALPAHSAVLMLIEKFPEFGITRTSDSNQLPITIRFPTDGYGEGSFTHQNSVIGLDYDIDGFMSTLIIFSPIHVVRGGTIDKDFSFTEILEMEDAYDLGDNIQHRLQRVGKDDYLAIVTREIMVRPVQEDVEYAMTLHMDRVQAFFDSKQGAIPPELSSEELVSLATDFGVLGYRGRG